MNASGDQVRRQATATVPPTLEPWWVTADVYAVPPRLSSTQVYEPDIAGTHVHGWVVIGDSMYRSSYDTGTDFQLQGEPRLERVGGGWGTFVGFEDAQYWAPLTTFYRHNGYGLRNDGRLFRWTVDAKGVWHSSGSYAGFSSVKSMALISKTRTYDTFLMNLRGGALYTVRIPTGSPMKPVVKIVRRGTWQGFESLIAEKCGTQGTLLVGIDKDTRSAYLYAVGHADGTATVIQSRGKLPGTFADPTYFRWGWEPDQLNGE